MLGDIKRYIKQRKSVNLNDLVLHFQTSPDAMKGMLDKWIKKGKATVMVSERACNGCTACEPSLEEYYEWCDSSSRSNTIIASSTSD